MRRTLLSRPRKNGFSLVEVLVALLVISIGMLGLAALYVETLQLNRTAIFRTQALTLASDMAERIRANTGGAASYADIGANSGCNDGAAAVECTSAQMAAQDVFDWQQSAQARLPGGTAIVAVVAAGPGTPNEYTLTITWTEVSQGGDVSYVMWVEA